MTIVIKGVLAILVMVDFVVSAAANTTTITEHISLVVII